MKIKVARVLALGFTFASTIWILGLAGCTTTDQIGINDPPTSGTNAVLPKIQVGDTVTISLTGSGIEDLPGAQEKPIKEDGTITLPDIGPVQAAGRTPGELEDIIHSLYVPRIYRHLNVTVKTSSDLVYFVRGEVKAPGRLIYVGPITVTKSITSAGDFTDFANHHKVYLIRANNGKRYRIDCDRILSGDDPDPMVYPGDQIEVKRRSW